MRIIITHSVLGPGVLTDERAESSHGQPVFVPDANDLAYGPGDMPGYLIRPEGVSYDAEQDAWFKRVRSSPESPVKWQIKQGRPVGHTVKTDDERTKSRSIWLTDDEYARLLAVDPSPSEAVRKLLR